MTGHLLIAGGIMWAAVANHLWQSTVFAGAAWWIALLLRKNRAKVRYGLWMAASVKFLIPFSLLMSFGSFLPNPQHAVISLQPALSSAVATVGQPFSELQMPDATNADGSLERYKALLPEALTGIWLCGLATILLVWCLRWRRIHLTLRDAAPVQSGREVEMLRRLEALARARRQIQLLRSREMMEPGIFGIFQPIMLWPEKLSERLENEHIEAIMAHELMHVRRHDNLTAAVHMIVEALFWFHPMVWWMESRLLEEREHACDEAAARLAGKPEIYAESLLKACRFCAESPVLCVSGITGSDLKKRIIRIMAVYSAQELNLGRKLLLVTAGFAALAVPVAFGIVHAAQSSDAVAQLPQFEVASIKPHKDDSGMMKVTYRFTPDGISINGLPLHMLFREAFGVADDRILGEPGWSNSARYDIEAKVDAADAAKLDKVKEEQRWAMMVPLLEERFGLKFHHETRELNEYVLVVAKGGEKLQVAKPEEADVGAKPEGGAGPGDKAGMGRVMMRISPQGMRIEGHGASTTQIAGLIEQQLGSTVVDKTDLKGKYDYTLEWTPEMGTGPMMRLPGGGPGGPPADGNAAPPVPTGPSLFTALQEQLGLKLQAEKVPVDVIVIDHIQRPSPN